MRSYWRWLDAQALKHQALKPRAHSHCRDLQAYLPTVSIIETDYQLLLMSTCF
jgi:hypothetical protein